MKTNGEMNTTFLRKRNLGIATLVLSLIIVVWFLANSKTTLDFHFDENPMEHAVSQITRENSKEPLTIEFDGEQMAELVSHLEALGAVKKQDRFAEETVLYGISTTSADGGVILINGYSMTEVQIEIVYQDNRYVVEDADFSAYFATVRASLMAQVTYLHLYEDFYWTTLQPISAGIQKLSLLDLDFNTIPELVVFTPGASASSGCVIFTIEQDEVRSFNTTDTISAYAGIDSGGPLAPLSQNASVPFFWANYLEAESLEFAQSRFLLCKERVEGQTSWILCSANGYDSGSWGTWYRFSTNEGALVVEPLLNYEFVGQWSHKSASKDQWYINSEEVTQTEYEDTLAAFLASLEQEYELVDYTLEEFIAGE